MKSLYLLSVVILFIACGKDQKRTDQSITYESEAKSPVNHGKEIFEGHGNCFACHQEDQKVIAPSLVEIATIYKKQNADIVKFLQGKGEPIVDPSQYATMKTNFSITTQMTDDELKALETYVMSFAK